MNRVNFVLCLAIIVLLFCSGAHAEALSADHWKFVCNSTTETIVNINRCARPFITPDNAERTKKLEECTSLSEVKIIEIICKQEAYPEEKIKLIMDCTRLHFSEQDERPNPVIKCIEDMPAFQEMMGNQRLDHISE